MDNNSICTTALTWQPDGELKLDYQKNMAKDSRDKKSQTMDRLKGKGVPLGVKRISDVRWGQQCEKST